jgi:hypothetical protein
MKLADRIVAQQRQAVIDLNALVKDIERCAKTIIDLKAELETVNVKHKDRKTTREDIDYLTDLLKCANKKLTWEKHIASLQKRTPAILEQVSKFINDPQMPPDNQMKNEMLMALQGVQAAMDKLQGVKVE